MRFGILLLALFLALISGCSKEEDGDSTPPAVVLISPAGGEFWSGTKEVAWVTFDGEGGGAAIEASTDAGATWTAIAPGASDTGSCSWDTTTFADAAAVRLRIRVADAAGNWSAWSACPADFTVDNTAPTVSLTSPTGGETLSGNATVTWTTTDANPSRADVELSMDSGTSWLRIASDVADAGTHTFDATLFMESASVRIRVRARDRALNASSWSASGTDVGIDSLPPSIVLTSPVGTEAWAGTHSITWTTADLFPGTVDIQISANSGGSWSPLASGVQDTGSYAWNTTGTSDGQTLRVRVRATDTGAHVSGWSACPLDFEVDNTPPTLALTSPTGGELWYGSHNITWTATDVRAVTVDLDMSRDAGANWSSLAAGLPNSGSWSWDTTTLAGGARIRIRVRAVDSLSNASTDASGDFTVVNYGSAAKLGGAGSTMALSASVDGAGNVFVAGRFDGTVDFAADWGGPADTKTAAGSTDAFVTRINADGSYGWTRRLGGTGSEQAQSVVVDGSGNVYVTGSFAGTVNFRADWGGTDSKTSAGGNDVFVTRLGADGSYSWTRRAGGTSGDEGKGIATDGSGNIFVAGRFAGTVDFRSDWGGTTDSRTGSTDAFVLRINADGSYGWVRAYLSSTFGEGAGVAADPSGNVYVIGWTAGTINFAADWGGTDSKGPTGFWQAEYLTRVNADGSYGWTRILGVSGGSWMTPGGVATDGSGNVYLSGTFMGTEDFRADWGSPTDSKTSAGGIDDAFVTKVMADGSYGWTRVIGSSNNDSAYGVCADGAGNVVVTGFFDGTVDFRADWGGSTDSKTSAGGTDAFVTLVNADGSYGWTRRMGGTGWDEGRAVAVGATGATAVVGVFAVTVDFKADWGGGSDTKTAASQNAFVVRFR